MYVQFSNKLQLLYQIISVVYFISLLKKYNIFTFKICQGNTKSFIREVIFHILLKIKRKLLQIEILS